MGEIAVHVVDDDPQVGRATARLLRACGIPVEIYETAVEFLNRLPEPGPGCLLLDLSMPGMTGLELQQLLTSQRRDLAIVFVTGTGDVRASVKAMKSGAADFLTKPFEDDELLAAVNDALCRSKQLCASSAALEGDWAVFQTLTAREQQVCLLVARGLLNKQIAAEVGRTEKTIKYHRASVMKKLHVTSIADLVRLVQRLQDAGRFAPEVCDVMNGPRNA
jgi:FixJ family two-component response regulator